MLCDADGNGRDAGGAATLKTLHGTRIAGGTSV